MQNDDGMNGDIQHPCSFRIFLQNALAPHRIVLNILEGLEKLDKIIPGVNNDETLLYGPEIKFFSNEITTDNNMKIENHNIYFVGDGAGKAGNIVTAAATGLIAARDILNKK